MKRLLMIILVATLLTGCSEAGTEELLATTKPTETEHATAEDVGTAIQSDMHNALISLGIEYYEIASANYKLTSSDSLGDEYTFDYTVTTNGVKLDAHGDGLISRHVYSPRDSSVSASLVWIARNEDYKMVWSCTDADLYDWKTGDPK